MTTTPSEYRYVWRIKPVRRHDALPTCAADFLEHEKARNFSIRTVQVHDFHIARFIDFCEERGIVSVHDVTRPVIVRFQRFLFYYRAKTGRPLSASTQAMALGALRSRGAPPQTAGSARSGGSGRRSAPWLRPLP